MSGIKPLIFVSKQLRRLLSLILLLLGLLFVTTPTMAQSPTPQPRAGDAPGTAAGCSELLVNGGFEVEGLGWQPLLPGSPAELGAEYVSFPVFAGTRSMRLGLVDAANTGLTNGVSQVVTLPQNADPIALNVQLLPVHEANPGTDLQFIDIFDASTNELLVRVWSQLSNRDGWLFQQFPLTSLAGRTVRVSIGVSNDGLGGKTALYVDSVSLQACDAVPVPTPTSTAPIIIFPTPTPTNSGVIIATSTPTSIMLTPTPVVWTPTPIVPTVTFTPILPSTPLPPGCITNVIINSGFEEEILGSTGWILGDDPVPPRLIAGGFEGLRSLQLGNPPNSGRADVLSYSSVRQLITIPHTAATAELLWWHWSHTQDNGEPAFQNRVDRQELILLSPDLVTLAPPLYRIMRNTGGWTQEVSDLTSHRGQSLYIYFNVLNDGDGLRTWMELDQVQLKLCFPAATPSPVLTLPADVSPLATPIVATFTPTGEGSGADTAATRSIIDVTEVIISPEGAQRTLDEAVQQVTEEQQTLVQRTIVLFQQFWWVLAIIVLLWAAWGFVSNQTK
ncbi:hypothetical protein GC175_02355 [bacterium]|nr:hypothetical protein [bacterium]